MKGTTMVAKSYITIIANVVHGAWSAFARTNPFERSSSTEEILLLTDIIVYTYQKSRQPAIIMMMPLKESLHTLSQKKICTMRTLLIHRT